MEEVDWLSPCLDPREDGSDWSMWEQGVDQDLESRDQAGSWVTLGRSAAIGGAFLGKEGSGLETPTPQCDGFSHPESPEV